MTEQCKALHYPKHSAQALGQDYINHVMAMTSEKLHAKSDIAIQLARRDAKLRRLDEVNATALRLLQKIFDAYEEGPPCNADDGQGYFIGNAVNLGTAADKEIIDFLEKYSPIAAVAKTEATK